MRRLSLPSTIHQAPTAAASDSKAKALSKDDRSKSLWAAGLTPCDGACCW